MTEKSIAVDVGNEEFVLRNRYQSLSIANDILTGVWFVIGSILFFRESTQTLATWCFLLGSIELLIRPTLKLIRNFHIRRL